ncbi:hypothetical protein PCL_07031 [Purpureocillium lilacinum]|uniref:Uncharacterized protein n=1 Tax=Purpureocillium lilacinum TaxID=33203 RepID=A0A2U3DT47_PURLI|nr:hypothetical protein PCL_07031 [Purpureocillium lilacinum]
MGDFCLVPLDDKISVLEHSIGVLEDIHDALQVKRDTVNCLICDLADLDGKTHRLMMQIQLMVLALKKELPPDTPTTPTVPIAPWNVHIMAEGSRTMP